ncbi:hypothetical protein [Mucilaginibacter auburnensis]|uniref:Uncharacterized protein n=1 Tax=Mucilaginibacter auburnensis TaxID=1457233 RepID=A0A2H9VTY9_9SPHI|nr:hypothetical protein [Mucilaginibacter auburnensis]PJJ84259.1 hypothetical protein CLV57_1269 [Mucilaginibacter auburnensis]
MIRHITFIIALTLVSISAVAQKWQPGYFYDKRGVKNSGFINQTPSGKGPIKNEAFIEYKEYEKDKPMKLSASDMKSYVVARDSFVVAASLTDDWAGEQLDFVRVAVNAPIKLYMAKVGDVSARQKPVAINPALSTGYGSGGMGGGLGGGIAINLGGRGRGSTRIAYLYGESTNGMKLLTEENFEDVMIEIMGDEPAAVDVIKNKKTNLRDIEKLIAYYHQLQDERNRRR